MEITIPACRRRIPDDDSAPTRPPGFARDASEEFAFQSRWTRDRDIPVGPDFDSPGLRKARLAGKLPENVPRQQFIDFPVPGYGLRDISLRIAVPIVIAAVRTRTHPASSSLRIRSVRFIQGPIRRPCETREFLHSRDPCISREDSPEAPTCLSRHIDNIDNRQESPIHLGTPCARIYAAKAARGLLL